MSFAVFGINKVKARVAAVKFIREVEMRSRGAIAIEAGKGGDLGRHFNNVISGGECPEQYEKALNQKFTEICDSAKPSIISKKYDAPAAAIEYLGLVGGNAFIKQQIGIVDGMNEPVFTKNGKKQKLEWLLFDRQAMKAIRK